MALFLTRSLMTVTRWIPILANHTPIMPGAVVRCRPIGVLVMEDEAGMDEKLLMVPVDKLHPFHSGVKSL